MNPFDNYRMDIFLEYMVKRKYTIKEYAKIILFFVGFLALAVILFYASVLAAIINPIFNNIFIIGTIAAVYFGYVLITRQNVEFEYSLTNTQLDFDKIIAKRRRIDVCEVDVRHLDEFEKINLNNFKPDKKQFDNFFVMGNVDSTAYYLVFKDKNGGKTMVIFNPPTKMVDNIRKFYKK